MKTVLRHETPAFAKTQCLFATGRSCITHLIRKFGPDAVLLPEMVPEGLYKPFEIEGVPIHYYPLRPDLEPDIDSVARIFRNRSEDQPNGIKRPIVVIVHYFGYWMKTQMMAALAHNYGGILLEDCAQCLPTKGRDDACGDVCLFSYNKVAPVTDGAFMLSCTNLANLEEPGIVDPFQPEAIDAYNEHLAANRIIANMKTPTDPLEGGMLSRMIRQSNDAYDRYYEIISKDMSPRRQSDFAARVVQTIDFDRIWSNRRSSAQWLKSLLPKRCLWRDDLPMFAFPIRCYERENVQMRLRDAGFIASRLWDRWKSPETNFWMNHLLLTIDENMKADDYKAIRKILRRA